MLSREKLLEDIQMNNTTETNEKLVEMNELNKMLDVQLNQQRLVSHPSNASIPLENRKNTFNRILFLQDQVYVNQDGIIKFQSTP